MRLRRTRRNGVAHSRRDIVATQSRAGMPGPNPLDAHLVVRPARPSTKKTMGRKRRAEGVLYIKYGSIFESTRYRESELGKAKAALDAFKRRTFVEQLTEDDPGDVLFKEMVKDHCDNERKLADTPSKLRKADELETSCVRVTQYFGEKPLASYTRQDSLDFVTWYMALRKPHYDVHPDDTRSPRNGARHLLRLLKKISREFDQRHDNRWHPDIHVPRSGGKKPPRWLRRDELARMLWACRGRRWDLETGGWKTKTYIDGNGEQRTTRVIAKKSVIEARRGPARAIRIGYRTGCRKEVLASLTWGRLAKLASFEVDDDGRGWLHRRGFEDEESNKACPSSELTEELECLMWIWKRQDGQSKRQTERSRKAR